MSVKSRIGKLEKELLPKCGDIPAEIASLSDAELVELICAPQPRTTLEERRWVIEQNPKAWSNEERELFLAGKYKELRTLMLSQPWLVTRNITSEFRKRHCRERTAGRK